MKKGSLLATIVLIGAFLGGCDRYQLEPEASLFLGDDKYSTNKNVMLNMDILENDDINGDVTVHVNSALHGEVSVEDGSTTFQYMPDQDWVGVDEFTYDVCNVNGSCETAQIRVNIVDTENDCFGLLEADNDVLSMDVNSKLVFNIRKTLLKNDVSCEDEDLLQDFTIVSLPLHGSLERTGDYLIYTPDAGFDKVDQFKYQIKSSFNKLKISEAKVDVWVGDKPPGFIAKHNETEEEDNNAIAF